MKIMLSSKYLASKLDAIDFPEERIIRISEDIKGILIETTSRNVYIVAEILIFSNPVKHQEDIRWDWLKTTIAKVPDQPVTLEIKENIVNLIFQY